MERVFLIVLHSHSHLYVRQFPVKVRLDYHNQDEILRFRNIISVHLNLLHLAQFS